MVEGWKLVMAQYISGSAIRSNGVEHDVHNEQDNHELDGGTGFIHGSKGIIDSSIDRQSRQTTRLHGTSFQSPIGSQTRPNRIFRQSNPVPLQRPHLDN